MYCYILASISLFADGQIPWDAKTVEGYSLFHGELDDTEGFGAYMDLPLRPGSRNFDNGGGSHELNSKFVSKYYGVENIVYDPFQRSDASNLSALALASLGDFDTTTSMSVLNVIDKKDVRLKHISLSCSALKNHGAAYFKIFENTSSGVGETRAYGYQANQPSIAFQPEVEEIFGRGNVVTDTLKHLIIAYKNSGCKG